MVVNSIAIRQQTPRAEVVPVYVSYHRGDEATPKPYILRQHCRHPKIGVSLDGLARSLRCALYGVRSIRLRVPRYHFLSVSSLAAASTWAIVTVGDLTGRSLELCGQDRQPFWTVAGLTNRSGRTDGRLAGHACSCGRLIDQICQCSCILCGGTCLLGSPAPPCSWFSSSTIRSTDRSTPHSPAAQMNGHNFHPEYGRQGPRHASVTHHPPTSRKMSLNVKRVAILSKN
jgi:hypothetical protein